MVYTELARPLVTMYYISHNMRDLHVAVKPVAVRCLPSATLATTLPMLFIQD